MDELVKALVSFVRDASPILFGAFASLAVALLQLLAATTPVVRRLLRRIRGLPEEEAIRESYTERLHRLTQALHASSREVDAVLSELGQAAQEREAAVRQLEEQLSTLTLREQELQKRIDALQSVPLPVAEHFAALTSKGEKRSARRDYLLFGLGVLVSTLLSVVFFLLQQ